MHEEARRGRLSWSSFQGNLETQNRGHGVGYEGCEGAVTEIPPCQIYALAGYDGCVMSYGREFVCRYG